MLFGFKIFSWIIVVGFVKGIQGTESLTLIANNYKTDKPTNSFPLKKKLARLVRHDLYYILGINLNICSTYQCN